MVHLKDEKDWVHLEVITETGLHLGWVRRVCLDADTNSLISLVIVPCSVRWLPEKVVSAYELASIHLVCVESKRAIAVEGAEMNLIQLEVGLLDRLGISKHPWDQDEGESYSTFRGDDDLGYQPAAKPRRPNPKPTDDAAEIPPD